VVTSGSETSLRGRSIARMRELIAHMLHDLFTRTRWVVAVTAAVALASCGDDGASAPSANSVADIVVIDSDAAFASAIDVRASGCGPRVRFGSGTTIANDLILTAAHVVAGTDEVEVIDTDGNTAAAEVVFFDPDLDLAALRPAVPIGEPAPLRATPARADEEGIIVLPRLIADVVETEIVNVRIIRQVTIRTTDIYLDNDVERKGFEVAAPIEQGDSGAVVHLPGGGVGVIWARSTENADRAWAVNIPDPLLDPTARNELLEPVDNGTCPG
jgi:hypothetical protein